MPFLPGSITTPEKTEGTDPDLASRTSCRNACGAVLLTHVCRGGGNHPEACQQSLGSFVQQKPEVTPTSCLAIFIRLLSHGLPCRVWRPTGASGFLRGGSFEFVKLLLLQRKAIRQKYSHKCTGNRLYDNTGTSSLTS